jgi:hypothetical protein
MTTSNFAKSSRDPNAVAISRGVPRWFKGKRYMPLAPSRELLDANDPKRFDREYTKQLKALDPREVYADLGPDAVLLCWEKFNVRCHRRQVAEWLEAALGIEIPEVGHDRRESIPFKEQPPKDKGRP